MSYVIYIDESYDNKSKYILMVGFIIPLEKWRKLNDEITQLKIKFFSNVSMNLKNIRRKKYDKNNYWDSLDGIKKEEFNREFYEIICKDDYTIIVGGIDKEKMDEKGKGLVFRLSYSFIIERYQYFLSDKGVNGIVVMDIAETSEEIKDLFYVHKEFMREGVPVKRKDIILKSKGKEHPIKDYERKTLHNICEDLIFMDDRDNNMLQITDMIAAAMFAKFNRKNDVWYNKVEKIIRKSDNGKIEGWGIKFFPEK